MRIGILKESLCLGGTERSAANTSKILNNEHQVFMVVYDASQTQYSYAGTLVDFGLPAKGSVLAKITNNFLRIYRYKKFIKKEKIQMLYEFISINNPISSMKHKNIPRIISARDFSVVCKCIERFHKCLQTADAMVCNSEYTKSFYLSKYPEHADKVFAVYNYINLEEINAQAQEPVEESYLRFLESHPKTVVSVGRFCKEKGFEYLIESIARARQHDDQLGLVLIGDGDYQNRYREQIESLGQQDHIYLTGFQKNPYKYMAKCSGFVLSSLSEGFPNVLAEAMALGLPVIATNCRSGPAEILRRDCDYTAVTGTYQECDYGIITPEMTDGDNENAIGQLSAAITALLASPEKMADYGKQAKLRAGDFSKEATAKQLEEIFRTLLGRKAQ